MALENLIAATGHRNSGVEDLLRATWDTSAWGNMAIEYAFKVGDPQMGFDKISLEGMSIANSTLAKSLLVDPQFDPDDPTTEEVEERPEGVPEPVFRQRSMNPVYDYFSNTSVDGAEIDGLKQKHYSWARNQYSYGSLNSPLEPFDGPFPAGMFVPVIYALIALLVIVALLDLLMNLIIDDAQDTYPNSFEPHNMKSGARITAPFGSEFLETFLDYLGWPKTKYGFIANLARGLRAFFNMPADWSMGGSQFWKDFLEMLLDVAAGPGYYLVVIKQIIRDFEQVGDAINSFSMSANFINDVLGIMLAFSTSVFWRFIIRMVELGDAYGRKLLSPGENSGAGYMDPSEQSVSRHLTPVARNAMTRYKDRGGSVQSTLSLSKHTSLFVANQALGLPRTVNVQPRSEFNHLVKNMAAFDKPTALTNEDGMIPTRLSPDDVRAIEEMAFAEYCPFTIHDVRTNEVIQLPAFIESIDDSFAADYQQTEGYGRTDPVRIHTSTKRSLSFTFRLVAMNPADHTYMWFVINRLIAMCYPQRSRGRLVVTKDGNTQFVQPFSQVPTSTPLVRIRVGELVHSNFSRSAFAKMMGSPGVLTTTRNADQKTRDADASKSLAAAANVRLAHDKFQRSIAYGDAPGKPASAVARYNILAESLKEREAIFKAGSTVRLVCVQNTTPSAFPTPSIPGADDPGDPPSPLDIILPYDLKVKISKAETVRNKKFKPAEGDKKSVGVPVHLTAIAAVGSIKKEEQAEKLLGKAGAWFFKDAEDYIKANSDSYMFAVMLTWGDSNIPYVVPTAEDIKAHMPDALKSDYEKAGTNRAGNDAVVSDHPLFRAFETTRGSGLAGVITQMGLNYEGAPWSTTPGSRAPQSVSINLSFEPIHDLPLGLDYTGGVIAPSHPVAGQYSNPHTQLKAEKSSWNHWAPAGPEEIQIKKDEPAVIPDSDPGLLPF